MAGPSVSPEIDRLITLLARLPGLGPRSARRAALHLLKAPERLMVPLSDAMRVAADRISTCSICANVDAADPCHICAAPGRDRRAICVVQDVSDLWAMERAGAFRGTYHVLGGTLSALDGVRPEDLNIASLIRRVVEGRQGRPDASSDSSQASQREFAPDAENHTTSDAIDEVILAMNATVDGQTTAHYITEHLEKTGVRVTRLAHGVPIGGELDYLDDGTIAAAMKSRRRL